MITKLNEYLNNTELVLEMARINDKQTYKYDVFVYGGDSYGTGRNEHGEPHFHFSDNIKNSKKFKMSILIPTETEWSQNKDLYIYESDSNNFIWSGLRKEKNGLIFWLDQPNDDLPILTNMKVIRYQWNVLNKDNKNVKQIKID